MKTKTKRELSLAQMIEWALENKMFGKAFRSKYGTEIYITLDGSLSILGKTSKDKLLALNDTFIVEVEE